MARRRSRSTRRRGWSLGDAIVSVVILLALAWAFVPGLGPDLAGLGDRFGWSPPGLFDPIAVSRSAGGSTLDDLEDSEAATRLRALEVRSVEDSLNVPDYDREQFGQSWADEDHNGCDTRNDILARDLARPVFKEGTNDCVVLSGTLAEPYTGRIVEFRRGQDTSSLVQIDHIVALADAWKSGAWQWAAAERQAFANDPDNLLAVDGRANQDKAAASADVWLPPDRDFHCEYVTRQIAVKTKWRLSVTAAEQETMAQALADCG